ncbi:hypothetical protein AB6A40_002201 [Gnathostoma spinigerum]|uniref:Uncharacterized protein n=1 Tax=Gnathostoma spinigerum TaxID=75299 RepID=A0ABD6E874_9BILA
MNGHSEHRSGEWSRQELYRSCMQALEGRCSTRSNITKEYELQIREFTATLECYLIDQLQKKLEELNEPDRLLISRLNRALIELGDDKSSVLSRPTYHLPSPTRPAHQVWTMCQRNPEGLEKMISTVCSMANIPNERRQMPECSKNDKPCDVKFSKLPPSYWNVDSCARYVLEQSEIDDSPQARQRRPRAFGSLRSITGYPLLKSSSTSIATTFRSTSSLPSPTLPLLSNKPTMTPDSGQESIEYSSPRKVVFANGDIVHEGTSRIVSKPSVPLEPSVLVRESNPLSFREISMTSESDSGMPSNEETLNSSNAKSVSSSECPSVQSTAPTNPNELSCDNQNIPPDHEPPMSSFDPSSSANTVVTADSVDAQIDQLCWRFGKPLLTRPIDVIPLPRRAGERQNLAISDSCGGVYVISVQGEVVAHIPIKHSSASSLAIDPTTNHLLVSVMHTKGRSIHIFDIENDFSRVEVITCPKEPKIELSRTRWITVSPRGEIFAVSGDNNKSAVWMYNRYRRGWKTLREARRSRYQYLCVAEDQAEFKAVVLLTCDAAQNKLLLFVVDHTGALISEYDLTKTYHLNDHIHNPASAVVDEIGNLLVLDYSTGRLWILLSGVKGIRSLKEIVFSPPIGAQQALGIAVKNDWVYVTCFNNKELISMRYLRDGEFIEAISGAERSARSGRRAISLPRPPRGTTVV